MLIISIVVSEVLVLQGHLEFETSRNFIEIAWSNPLKFPKISNLLTIVHEDNKKYHYL